MPKKKSESSPAAKPKKTPGTKRGTKAAGPEQADLFEDLPAVAAPKVPKTKSAPKSEKPRTTAKKTTPPPAPKPASTPTSAATKPYIQIIPYASVLVIGYVALVLAWDALVTIGDTRTVNWAVFQWHPAQLQALLEMLPLPHFLLGWMSWPIFAEVDLFKLLFWLAIPAALCLWRMDWDYFTKQRVKPVDWRLLGAMCVLAVAAIISVKFIPALAHIYPGSGETTLLGQLRFFIAGVLWVLSWLVGWEFMHRYFLLRRVSVDFPRFGWLLIPLAEGAYHLVKPWPEMLAMVAFSVAMTQYTLRRRNLVIPFLAHFAVELFLIVGRMFW